MSEEFKLKDSLYYSDLIYEIKKLANFDIDMGVDLKTWERIKERKKEIRVYETFDDFSVPSEYLSPFKSELLEIIGKISKKANTVFGRYEKISEYPLLVLEELEVLEKKKIENEMLINLKVVVRNMGLENKFSLGEPANQCVCLDKNYETWEVYVVENGKFFEKDCFDACIDVINLLADSKQMYEEAKENFSLVRRLTPNK